MAKLRITYTKSAIGYSKDQKATIRSLGLHKLNSNVIQADTLAIRGMIFKVQHLVKVEQVGDDATRLRAPAWRRPLVLPALAPDAPAPADDLAVAVAPAPDAPAPADDLAVAVAPAPDAPTPADDLAVAVAPAPDAPTPADDLAVAVAPALDAPAPADDLAVAVAPAPDAPAPADDLAVIEGIGPKIASVLREAGISTFAQLATTDVARLTEILQEANLRLAVPESWPEQAELAQAGDWDTLKQLQDRLKGGRRE